MASTCPKCDKTVYFAEKVTSLGKDWHRFCLKCERCSKTLTAGSHAEHDGMPYCHRPCYAALFGPKGTVSQFHLALRLPAAQAIVLCDGDPFLICPGVNIGGAGSYVYDTPVSSGLSSPPEETAPKPQERKASGPPRGPVKAASITTFSGEPSICPRCNKKVYFAEKVTSLGQDWHRPCLRCERCSKTLAPGSHAEHDGQPYCHKPCYAVLFGPRGIHSFLPSLTDRTTLHCPPGGASVPE
uniref:Cysteine-rich protein 2 n=1 Tax=Paramormyrops kingsleyae TaxID=1676925 RepID=A0A3B3S0A5_9TELE